jgi:Flp pilus assembly protein TadG
MVEFALILPVLLIIVAGLLSFGRVFFYWLQANHEANEAVRWAVVDRNPYAPTSLQQHVRDQGTIEFASDVAVCIDFPEAGVTFATVDIGDAIRVRVRKEFDLLPVLGAGTIAIRGSATQRLERMENSNPSAFTLAGQVNPGAFPAGEGTCPTS